MARLGRMLAQGPGLRERTSRARSTAPRVYEPVALDAAATISSMGTRSLYVSSNERQATVPSLRRTKTAGQAMSLRSSCRPKALVRARSVSDRTGNLSESLSDRALLSSMVSTLTATSSMFPAWSSPRRSCS